METEKNNNGKHCAETNDKRIKIKLTKPKIVIILLVLVAIIAVLNIKNIFAYFTSFKVLSNPFSVVATYTVTFDGNTGTGTMADQVISYNVDTELDFNEFNKEGNTFDGWNTEPDGSGTMYIDGESVRNLGNITLYAQWAEGEAVAEINGVRYATVQDAINAVPTNNTETTIKLLKSVAVGVSLNVAAHKNIVFNLQNYTISQSASIPIFENYGKIKFTNGKLTSDAAQGMINNRSGGELIITGGKMITTGKRQVIYNDGGTVTISGNAYLSSDATSSERATVQNAAASGTITITGGTIKSLKSSAIVNAGKLIIGTKDNDNNPNSLTIQGAKYAVETSKNFDFYDGKLKGVTDAINDVSKLKHKESGYELVYTGETIDGKDYKVALLGIPKTVTFNPNGGTTSEPTREVAQGEVIGPLPTAELEGHNFGGWYTEAEGGTKITANTVINEDVEYFAHWKSMWVAEIDGTKYTSLKEALNNVPADNTETTITMLQDVSETVTVDANKNVVLDIGDNTISSKDVEAVITNKGKLKIISGTIEQNEGFGAINNNDGGELIITGGRILSKGGKACVYTIERSSVLISGDAYLESNCEGFISGNERGTVQSISTRASITITGGTIVSTTGLAVSTIGPLTIGTKGDGATSTTDPKITGHTYGVKTRNPMDFYDGIIRGITDSIEGTINETETGYVRHDDTETSGGVTYKTTTLVAEP